MSLQLNTIYNEDCLETMKRMPDNYLHAIVTDPPYGLSFMGKAWDYDVPKVEIWREALRVLKPGGHLLAFAGSRTYHRMAVAIEDAGFEIRDQLIWMYGSGFPKSLNIGKAVDKLQGNEREVVGTEVLKGNAAVSTKEKGGTFVAGASFTGVKEIELTKGTSEWEGYGTALKPAHEPCVLARKPIEGTVANNVLKHGTGGLNIDGTRVGAETITQTRTQMKAWRASEGRTDIPESADNSQTQTTGRFPANLIHDGSDEVVGLFPQTGKSKAGGSSGTTFATGSTRTDPRVGHNDNGGSASRYFYTAKASKRERGQGNSHPTVKPIALMKYLVKLVAPPKNGIIYDPFSGSGTTLLACQKLGIDFIGSEISKEYCDIAEERLRH